MNIRKIVAIFAALSVSAVSVTGLAADVSTTTTYNTESGKVEVTTAVTGATVDSEVTYIVKSEDEVVYIDQDTAEEGSVKFTYKIDKAKITDYSTSVKFGSSSESDAFSGTGVKTLGIEALQQAGSDAHYTITYPNGEKAWGSGDTVFATVVPDYGYEITAIYVGEEEVNSESTTVELNYGQVITAYVREIDTEPGLSYTLLDTSEETGDNAGLKSRVVILKPQGAVKSIGVMYNGDYYASSVNVMSAVKIIFPESEKDYELIGAYEDGNGVIHTLKAENAQDSEQ